MTALNTLLQQAQNERDLALAAVHREEENLSRLQLQSQQLLNYRAEYQARWQLQFQNHSAIEIVHCYRTFMQRLDEAVTQQQRQADNAAAMLERQRSVLTALELRVASVRKLLERRQTEQQRLEHRADQRQTDEAALQAHRRQASAGH